MPLRVVRYEDTPNPNAMKCWLSDPVSDGPRSFRSRESAEVDPLARALFEEAGATSVLLFGTWMTVNKAPGARWPAVKKAIERVMASVA